MHIYIYILIINLRLEAKLYELQEELEEEGKTKEEIDKELDKLRTKLQSSMVRDDGNMHAWSICYLNIRLLWGGVELVSEVLILSKKKNTERMLVT